jgi:hypothetical protein
MFKGWKQQYLIYLVMFPRWVRLASGVPQLLASSVLRSTKNVNL